METTTTEVFVPATKQQTWALFCATKIDFRGLNLSKAEASEAIDALRNGKPLPPAAQELLIKNGMEAKAVKSEKVALDFEAIHNEAHTAGIEAAKGAVLQPFDVKDMSTGKVMVGADDTCGFAWVHLSAKSGPNRAFVKWGKAKGLLGNDYPKGFSLWVNHFGQSMSRKEAYAGAYAGVLGKYGIEAYPQSRMD